MRLHLLVFLPLLWLGPCDEPFTSPVRSEFAGECIDVSYVAGICGEAVLKIESKDFQSLGEEWNGNEHVFFTVLPCGTDEAGLKTGTFKVLLNESNSIDFGDCVRCKATVAYDGKKRYEIAFPASCSK